MSRGRSDGQSPEGERERERVAWGGGVRGRGGGGFSRGERAGVIVCTSFTWDWVNDWSNWTRVK